MAAGVMESFNLPVQCQKPPEPFPHEVLIDMQDLTRHRQFFYAQQRRAMQAVDFDVELTRAQAVDGGRGCVLRAAGGVGCTVLSSRCWAGGQFFPQCCLHVRYTTVSSQCG